MRTDLRTRGLTREETREFGPGKSVIAYRYSTDWTDEYINSRGMFHEPERCLRCEDCEKEWLEDESRWIRE